MKKITPYLGFYYLCCTLNPLAAMNEYKESTSQHSYSGPVGLDLEEEHRMWSYIDANNIIKAAVQEAVGNDPAPITLHVQEFENCSGYCDSIHRVIGIDRRLAMPEASDALAWVTSHETEHLRDKINQKINFYGRACTILGGLLPATALRLLCKKRLPITTGLLSTFGACASYITFKKLGGERYCISQGELRADTSAIERLLKAKKFTVVTYALKDKLTSIAFGHERCGINHPTYQKECNNMVKTIRKNGYDVQYVYDEERINNLRKINAWRFTPLTVLCLLKNNQPVAYDASKMKLAEMKS